MRAWCVFHTCGAGGRFNNDDDEAVARDVEPVLYILSRCRAVVDNSASGAVSGEKSAIAEQYDTPSRHPSLASLSLSFFLSVSLGPFSLLSLSYSPLPPRFFLRALTESPTYARSPSASPPPSPSSPFYSRLFPFSISRLIPGRWIFDVDDVDDGWPAVACSTGGTEYVGRALSTPSFAAIGPSLVVVVVARRVVLAPVFLRYLVRGHARVLLSLSLSPRSSLLPSPSASSRFPSPATVRESVNPRLVIPSVRACVLARVRIRYVRASALTGCLAFSAQLVLGSVSPVKRERRRLLVRTRGTASRRRQTGRRGGGGGGEGTEVAALKRPADGGF